MRSWKRSVAVLFSILGLAACGADEPVSETAMAPEAAVEAETPGALDTGLKTLGRTLDEWSEVLGADDEEQAEEARLRLVLSGVEAIPVLASVLATGNPQARWHALVAARETTESVVALLPEAREGLQDEAWAIRAAAVDVIAKLSDGRDDLLPVLGAALRDPHSEVGARAALALKAHGGAAVPYYLQALRSDDILAQQRGDTGLRTLSTLRQAEQLRGWVFSDPNFAVRASAARNYARILVCLREYERLEKELGSADPATRRALVAGIDDAPVWAGPLPPGLRDLKRDFRSGKSVREPVDSDEMHRRVLAQLLRIERPDRRDRLPGGVPTWSQLADEIEARIIEAKASGRVQKAWELERRLALCRRNAR